MRCSPPSPTPLVDGHFRDYDGLVGWLQEEGYAISRSALGRYGQELKGQFEQAMAEARRMAELARAWTGADPDDLGAMTDASVRMAQTEMVRLQMAVRDLETTDPEDIQRLGKLQAQIAGAVERLGRVAIAQTQHARRVREEIAAEQAEHMAAAASSRGVSPEAVEAIRAAMLAAV